ncbi:hypothetical protein EC968_006123 [Mortierella alpina]|nr:hypothetical protein EC968_006123 [Mortierella alpina]
MADTRPRSPLFVPELKTIIRSKSPFDLPELRAIIKTYLTRKDALACSRVCRVWSNYFLDFVWDTIDFATINESKLTSTAIIKHGHHIRVIKNLNTSYHMDLLMWKHQSLSLRSLSVILSADLAYQTDLYDFLRLVRGTITELDIAIEPPKVASAATTLYGAASNTSRTQTSPAAIINVPVDVILPREPSRLTKISLRGLQISPWSLTALLQGCPDLQDLALYDMHFPSRSLYTDWTFKHPNLRHLSAPFEGIMAATNDRRFSPIPPLLGVFPGLGRWTVWTDSTLQHSSLKGHMMTVRNSCPKLKQIELVMESAAAVKDFVTGVFTQIESLTFMHKALSSEVVIAMLGHSKTLKRVECVPPTGTVLDDPAKLPVVADHFRSSAWTLLTIPRLCPHLESLCFPLCEVEMDDIEKGDWECKGLKKLRIRIAGLDTAVKIDRAIGLWLDGRRFHQRNEKLGRFSFPMAAYLGVGHTLEARVAVHLLKFKELHTVWLGTRVWRV